MFKNVGFMRAAVRYSSTLADRKVWVVTDGAIESTLQALALGKRLAGSNTENLKLKTIVSSERLRMFPSIIQKYIVDYSSKKSNDGKLPWYLSYAEDSKQAEESQPDYIIASGHNAVPACLYLSKAAKNCFSVYLGYPNIPFINFNQVILPKYEANAKMAVLGPLARQKNGIITPAPILDTSNMPNNISNTFFKSEFSAVVVGGYSADCKWYSEDALSLADNIKRMVQRFGDKIVIIFTDKTPDLVKEKIQKRVQGERSIKIWDSTLEKRTMEKIKMYEDVIINAQRVILTADLDYATAHAISKSKPVYLTFGGHSRSYLLHFYRWVVDNHLVRKLRMDRGQYRSSKVQDEYSYLGNHAPWGNANNVFQMENTMSFVTTEIQAIKQENLTGKRRQ